MVTLMSEIEVAPAGNYPRKLKFASKWKCIGKISEGSVFEIQDDVFMLEAKHMHQAHMVLGADERLVGFYLPVEQAFVPLSPSIQLNFK